MTIHKAPLLQLYLTVLLILFYSLTAKADTAKKLEEIKKLTDTVINKAVNNSDYSLFQAGTESRLALDAWKRINKDQLEIDFQQLDEQEQRFLFALGDTMRLAADDSVSDLNNTHGITTKIQQLVKNEGIWGSYPAILKTSPAVVHNGHKKEMISISLLGENLNFDDAILEVNSKKYEAVETTPYSITFQLPASQFKFDDTKSSILNASFSATIKPNWFKSIYQESELITIKLEFLQLPKKLADYHIHYVTHTATRNEYLMHENLQFFENTPSWTCKDFNYQPGEDKKIDIDSVKAIQTSAREGKFRVVGATEQGITLELCAKRWSDLKQAQISTGPGNIDVELNWKEYLSKDIKKKVQQKGQLEWGKDYSTKLPDNSSKISVETTLFNGLKRVATKSGVLNEFLYLDYDPKKQKLIIKQNRPSELSVD